LKVLRPEIVPFGKVRLSAHSWFTKFVQPLKRLNSNWVGNAFRRPSFRY